MGKLYARFVTSMGHIVAELFPEKAPETVENFTALAQGTKEWVDPRTGQRTSRPLYNNLQFHRVIPKFMIQGGCPLGTGTGGPGYRFKDEIAADLGFDQAGRLAMANAGPNTNGSQFFITAVPTPHLDGKHTIFGQVVEGMNVIEAVGLLPRDDNDKPTIPVIINRIVIERPEDKKPQPVEDPEATDQPEL